MPNSSMGPGFHSVSMPKNPFTWENLRNVLENPPHWDQMELQRQEEARRHNELRNAKLEIKAGPGPSEYMHTLEDMENTRIEAHKVMTREWLMSLPFLMAPTAEPVSVKIPVNSNAVKLVREFEDAIRAHPEDTPKSRKSLMRGYEYTWYYDAPMQDVDINAPSAIQNRQLVTDQQKLDILGKFVQGVAKVGSYVTPEALKKQLLPSHRALLHYLSGRGTPSTVNLDYNEVAKNSEVLEDYDITEPIQGSFGNENALRKSLAWPEIAKVLAGTPAVRALSTSPIKGELGPKGFEDAESNPMYHTLGTTYFATPEVVFDDYRFYPQTSFIDEITPQRMWKAIKESTRLGDKHPAWNTDIEAWLAKIGKPFPVIIPRAQGAPVPEVFKPQLRRYKTAEEYFGDNEY